MDIKMESGKQHYGERDGLFFVGGMGRLVTAPTN